MKEAPEQENSHHSRTNWENSLLSNRRTVLKSSAAIGLSGIVGLSSAESLNHESGVIHNTSETTHVPRFGVNYVPSKNWWFTWKDEYWAPESIQEDLNAIASIKMDHVRIFTIWPWFQPREYEISVKMLDRLEQIFEMADNAGLDVQVTVLQGHLSGYEWYPSWVGGRSYVTSDGVVAAQKRLFEAIANHIGDHPRFMGFDLGNEINATYHHFNNAADSKAYAAWLRDLLSYCHKIAPQKKHVASTAGGLLGLSAERIKVTAREGDISIVHPWVFEGASDEAGNLTFYGTHHQGFLTEAMRAYQTDPNRQIWHQEIGAPLVNTNRETNIPKSKRADWTERVVNNIMTGHENIYGITWWSSHDIREAGPYNLSKERKALEYTLGLFTTDNKPKPIAKRFGELAEHYRKNPPNPNQTSTITGINEDRYFNAVRSSDVPPQINLANKTK